MVSLLTIIKLLLIFLVSLKIIINNISKRIKKNKKWAQWIMDSIKSKIENELEQAQIGNGSK